MGNTLTGSGTRFGHRVLETTEGSPSFHAGLVSYMDFVVAINDVQLVGRVVDFCVVLTPDPTQKMLELGC